MTTTDHNDEQFWQACLYVMGELSETEREQFEDRLAADVKLCDYVVEATQLMACAQTVDPVLSQQIMPATASAQQSTQIGRSLASFAALAACLALLFVVTRPVNPPAAADPDAGVLVDAWLDNGLDFESADETENEVLTPEIDVPDWMIAGVSLAELELDDGSMPDDVMPDDLMPDGEDMEL